MTEWIEFILDVYSVHLDDSFAKEWMILLRISVIRQNPYDFVDSQAQAWTLGERRESLETVQQREK